MKKRFGFIATIVAAASFFSLITASVAWFEARTDVDFGTGHGSTAAAYFESGSGKSEAEAYVISSPIHMYNLAWLQYLGQFNTTVSPTYFKLKNDIDMSALGSALPPIGTQANPFIGIFDGQSHTISNLTVSNNINDIAKHPSTVQALSGVSVVGFFGIVGNPQPIGIQRGDTDLDYTELQVFDKLNLHHFNLQNVVVKSTTAQTLMGIVAGYVNGHDGTVHDIGVMNGSLQAAQGATCLQHFADDDADDPARPISKFSLIGETEDTEWKEAYDDSGTGSGDGPGDDASFGGSIDMKVLSRRINYMMTKSVLSSAPSSNNSYSTSLSGFNFNLYSYTPYSGDNYEYYWKSTVGTATTASTNYNSVVYLKGDDTVTTCLPINVDETEMGLDSETESTVNVHLGSSSKTWHINGGYSSKNSETPSSTNTGYLVSGTVAKDPLNTTKTSPASNGSIRMRIANTKSIQRSLGQTRTGFISSYVDNNLIMLTHDPVQDSNTSFCMIGDDLNSSAPVSADFTSKGYTRKNYGEGGLNLNRYSNVRTNFSNMLSGQSNIYGLGFMRAIDLQDLQKYTFNSSNIKIAGSTKTSYSMIKHALNFTLKTDGFVTTVLGSYYSDSDPSGSSGLQKIPDIFQVSRTSDTNITGITKISTVWENDEHYYLNLNNPGSGYTKVFDREWYSQLPLARSAYYAEIHLPAGEYVMGADARESSNSAYLIYLDIGANGNGSGGGGTTPTGDYDLKNVRYVHQIVNNGSTDSSDDYIDILFKISTAGANGTVALYFSRHDATVLYYHQNGTATNVDVTVFIAKETNIQDNTSAVWAS